MKWCNMKAGMQYVVNDSISAGLYPEYKNGDIFECCVTHIDKHTTYYYDCGKKNGINYLRHNDGRHPLGLCFTDYELQFKYLEVYRGN